MAFLEKICSCTVSTEEIPHPPDNVRIFDEARGLDPSHADICIVRFVDSTPWGICKKHDEHRYMGSMIVI